MSGPEEQKPRIKGGVGVKVDDLENKPDLSGKFFMNFWNSLSERKQKKFFKRLRKAMKRMAKRAYKNAKKAGVVKCSN